MRSIKHERIKDNKKTITHTHNRSKTKLSSEGTKQQASTLFRFVQYRSCMKWSQKTKLSMHVSFMDAKHQWYPTNLTKVTYHYYGLLLYLKLLKSSGSSLADASQMIDSANGSFPQ